MAFDFPANPFPNTIYTSPDGVTYAWNGYAWMRGAATGIGGPPPAGDYVLKTGDTMTGPLTLNADPAAVLHAATKQYVDAQTHLPPIGVDGQALVTQTGVAVWGAPIEGGDF